MRLLLVLLLLPGWAWAGEAFPCRLDSLHPLQGALGREQARYGAARIAERPGHEWRALERDPIKVVRGPGGALFILDHHHGAEAWRLAGRVDGVCEEEKRPPFGSAAAFWAGLERDRLVRLADKDGRPITPDQLPPTLAAMPDDPFRTLAGHLRRAGAFCRSAMQTEFAEFTWADWLRTRMDGARVGADPGAAVPAATALVRGAEAASVPGYRAPGAQCP